MGLIQNGDVLFLNGRWLMKYGEIPIKQASFPAVGNEMVGFNRLFNKLYKLTSEEREKVMQA